MCLSLSRLPLRDACVAVMAGVRGFLGRSWVMVRGSGVLVIVQWSNEGCLWLKVFCVCPAGEGSRARMVSGGLWLWFVPAGEGGRGGCVRGGGRVLVRALFFMCGGVSTVLAWGGWPAFGGFVGGESGVVVLWWC